MCQIKEKAPATPASVTSANLNNYNQDTTNPAKKQPFEVSEYLEYCAHVGKQPNESIIEFMKLNNEPSQYTGKTRKEIEVDLTKEMKTLLPAYRGDIIEFAGFLRWRKKRNHT